MMKPNVDDILEGKPEPLWWDWRGIPRWAKWYPGIGLEELPEVRYHALIVVHCQECGRPYVVDAWNDPYYPDLKTDLEMGFWTYGGLPNGKCCEVGPLTEAIGRAVLRFYELTSYSSGKWVRVPDLEIEILPPWAREEFSKIDVDYQRILSKVLHPSIV